MPKPKKTNIKNVDVDVPDLFKDKPKRTRKKTKNSSLTKEVLERLNVSTELAITKDMIVSDLPNPDIKKASEKFGFEISGNDKIIDIATKIGKWYN